MSSQFDFTLENLLSDVEAFVGEKEAVVREARKKETNPLSFLSEPKEAGVDEPFELAADNDIVLQFMQEVAIG